MLVWLLSCAFLSAALIISSASSWETSFMPEEEFNDEGGGVGSGVCGSIANHRRNSGTTIMAAIAEMIATNSPAKATKSALPFVLCFMEESGSWRRRRFYPKRFLLDSQFSVFLNYLCVQQIGFSTRENSRPMQKLPYYSNFLGSRPLSSRFGKSFTPPPASNAPADAPASKARPSICLYSKRSVPRLLRTGSLVTVRSIGHSPFARCR